MNNLTLRIIFIIVSGTAGVILQSSTPHPLQKEIEQALLCQCGCGMGLAACSHTDCPFAIPERQRITQMLSENKSQEEILNFYQATFSQQVLASPPKSDFMAWLTPILIALLALGVLLVYLKNRTRKTPMAEIKQEEEKVPYNDTIENELKEME